MPSRTSSIIGWICFGLVLAFNLFAAVMKYVPVVPDSEGAKMMERLGLTVQMQHVLGVVEFAIVALFLIPRTRVVGFILMVGYLGGALATNITHGFTFAETVPMYVTFALLALGGWLLLPELTARLRGRPM